MRILLTHTPEARERYYGDEALADLRKLGEVILNSSNEPLGTGALLELARNCDVIVSDRQTPGDSALFAAATDLVAFLRCAMDIRSIDVSAASRAGILITRATAGFVDSVAELAIGFMVDLARGVSRSAAAYTAGRMPEIRMGRQLAGSIVGVIGYGAIGRRVGSLAHAFGMEVLAADPYERFIPDYVGHVALAELLQRANFVICLAPATAETHHMMNRATFSMMRRGSYFINLARGELVDEGALAAALDNGHLAGAAIDVGSAPDQMPSLLLAQRSNVVATPHIGGLTPEAVQHQAYDTVRQVTALCEGRMPEGAVNAAAAHRLARLGIPVP